MRAAVRRVHSSATSTGRARVTTRSATCGLRERSARRRCDSDSGAEVETEVAAMLDAILECDAVDVIELTQLMDVRVASPMDGQDGSAGAIDRASLVFLPCQSSMPGGTHSSCAWCR